MRGHQPTTSLHFCHPPTHAPLPFTYSSVARASCSVKPSQQSGTPSGQSSRSCPAAAIAAQACREQLLRPDVLAALWAAISDDPIAAAAGGVEAERREARRVRAAMALANLTGADTPVAAAAHPSCPADAAERLAAAVAQTVEMLGVSMEGGTWAGVAFAPYSVLYPLARLARHPSNLPLLADAGVAPHLTAFLLAWPRAGPRPERTLALALALAAPLSSADEAVRRRLRAAGAVAALRAIAECAAAPPACRAAAGAAAGELEGARWAVRMAAHPRLGAHSTLGRLDPDLLALVARTADLG
jgi:hypothetical protein